MTRPKNILLIMTDEQRFDTVAALGNPHIKTPNLDRLFCEGIACTRHYSSTPLCTPARATVITGRHTRAHGAWRVGDKLAESVPTLPGHLSDLGFHTGLIGKAHYEPELPGRPQRVPDDEPYYGFQTHLLCEDNIEGPYTRYVEATAPQWREEIQYTANESLWPDRDDPHAETPDHISACRPNQAPEHLQHTHWIADRSIDYLNDRAADGQPFFLKTSFVQPHHPYAPPQRYMDMYPLDELPDLLPEPDDWPVEPFAYCQVPDMTQREGKRVLASYYAMITFIDDQVGRMLATLEANGQLDETVIAFTSDHGDYAGHRGLIRKNATFYEEIVRVPMVWRLPDRERAGTTIDTPTQHEDLAITFCELLGVDPHADFIKDGISLIPAMTGTDRPRRDYAFIEDYKQERLTCGIVMDDWKLLHLPTGRWWLVNFADDPTESTNRHGDPTCADVEMKLRSHLLDHLMATEVWLPERVGRW